MGDNKGAILSVPRQHLYDWGKWNKIMAVISSLASIKWDLNDSRIWKSFYLFHIVITNRRGLIHFSFYFDGKSWFNKYADKLQKSSWLQLHGMSILYSVFIDLQVYCEAVRVSLWLRKPGHRAVIWFARVHTAAPERTEVLFRSHFVPNPLGTLSYGRSMDTICSEIFLTSLQWNNSKCHWCASCLPHLQSGLN